ncbi:hypothetical protein PP939_gp116 [Rhizobium phage RL38J1]|uniref:Transmembrane protein n=1 Tax=Rhizobium phage RL38J1 TaxID=2663232 RepID=A0A6B9J166_9CAUD|nr:hypothetical protein PP939_gp116 [Rhizobium phage RL38J1]QGZ14019.1 hypothetical protein RL38J1_116 [Rhizobium phage RL38J1]
MKSSNEPSWLEDIRSPWIRRPLTVTTTIAAYIFLFCLSIGYIAVAVSIAFWEACKDMVDIAKDLNANEVARAWNGRMKNEEEEQ